MLLNLTGARPLCTQAAAAETVKLSQLEITELQRLLHIPAFGTLSPELQLNVMTRLAFLNQLDWLTQAGAEVVSKQIANKRFAPQHFVTKYRNQFLYSGLKIEPRFTALVKRDLERTALDAELREMYEVTRGDRQTITAYQVGETWREVPHGNLPPPL